MIRYTLTTGMLFVCGLVSASSPQYNTSDIRIEGLEVKRDGSRMNVNCNIDASSLKLKSNQEVNINPVLTSGNDTLCLAPITVAGRNRFFFHERNNDLDSDSKGLYHNGKDASNISYSASVAYEDWMNISKLGFILDWNGCCNAPVMNEEIDYANIDMGDRNLTDLLAFVEPKGTGEKLRHVDGRAFIDFPVSKTIINADYRNNAVELAKISNTIDNVRKDKDVTITSISIKGFASPEGSYSNNERLAQGRTQSLVKYVHDLYKFPESVKFISSWEAEDWDGLKSYVEKSEIPAKEGIIDIINSGLQPDEKEAKIKSAYPADYKWLLANVFPTLRHSDYVIEYTIKEYTDANEIIEVMRTDPSKLSLAEMYFAAQSSEPGSDLFNEIFETAARLHPKDETANLNAANASLSRGDTEAAANYLAKAGSSNEAVYAKAMMMIMNKDYDAARSLLEGIRGFAKAQELLESLESIARSQDGYGKVSRIQ